MNFIRRFIHRPQSVFLRKALFQVHLWTGLAVGLYVLVVSISGSAVVFREEMNNAVNRHLFMSSSRGPLADVETVVAAVRTAYPGHQVGGIYPPAVDRQTYLVYVRKDGVLIPVFADPVSGNLIGELKNDDSFVRWLQELHFELLAGPTGEIVNGFAAMAVVLLCMTGLVICGPECAAGRAR